MKLLICTQVVDVNHPILGFFHRWIEEFAKHCSEVHVICLQKGTYNLPSHVHVHSLGKEEGAGRITYVWRFFQYIVRYRKEYDSVFVHMNQIYVILGGVLWRLWGKRIGLWYMHRSIDWILRAAEKCVDYIFTASKESFRLKSKKLYITGHGIDTTRFTQLHTSEEKEYSLLTVGRITPSKNLKLLVDVISVLSERGRQLSLSIIGAPLTESEIAYQQELQKYISEKNLTDQVYFLGSVPNEELPVFLGKTKIFIHAATNGSLDKTLLEPLAMGIPVITSAEGAASLQLGAWHVAEDAIAFADAIDAVLTSEIGEQLSALSVFVHTNHSIEKLIPRILTQYEAQK